MRPATIFIALLGLAAAAGSAAAENVVAALSEQRVEIRSNFVGTELTLFGIIQRDAATVSRAHGYDVVVSVRGPDEEIVTRRKDRVAGIWVNTESVTFRGAPSYYAALANRPIGEIAGRVVLRRTQTGLAHLRLDPVGDILPPDHEVFREAMVRRKAASGLYIEDTDAVELMTPTMFMTRIPLPANIRTGGYRAHIHLFGDGALLATERLGFWVVKSGFEERVFNLAERRPLVYGLVAVAVAVFAGWFAGVIFRRD